MLYVRVLSEAPLEYVDVVRPTGVARRELPEDIGEFEDFLELPGLEKGDYVYVRAVQRDGGAAWSSPFFVQ